MLFTVDRGTPRGLAWRIRTLQSAILMMSIDADTGTPTHTLKPDSKLPSEYNAILTIMILIEVIPLLMATTRGILQQNAQ